MNRPFYDRAYLSTYRKKRKLTKEKYTKRMKGMCVDSIYQKKIYVHRSNYSQILHSMVCVRKTTMSGISS